MATLGYFISFHTYGTWLHGRLQESVDEEHATPGTPHLTPDAPREQREGRLLKHAPVELDAERRYVVDTTILEVCAHRGWRLRALHVRSTHLHAVVSATPAPERIMNDFKACATRRMREAGVLSKDNDPWSRHGSTRYLNTENSFARAVQYVLYEQGEHLEVRCPAGWTPKVNVSQINNPPAKEPRTC